MRRPADIALVKEFKTAIRALDVVALARLLDSLLESLALPRGTGQALASLQEVLSHLRRKPDLLRSVLLAEPYEKRLQRLTLADELPYRDVAAWLSRDRSMIARINWRLPASVEILRHFSPIADSGFLEHISSIAQENSHQALAIQKACYTSFVAIFAEAWPRADRVRSRVALYEYFNALALSWRARLVFCAWVSGQDHDQRVLATLSELGFLGETEFRREFGQLREQSWIENDIVAHESRIVHSLPAENRDEWRFTTAALGYLSSYRCCEILCNEGLVKREALELWNVALLDEIAACDLLDAFLRRAEDSAYSDLQGKSRDELVEIISAFDRHLGREYEDMWDQLYFRLNERPHMIGMRLKQLGFDLETTMPQTAKIVEQLTSPHGVNGQ